MSCKVTLFTLSYLSLLVVDRFHLPRNLSQAYTHLGLNLPTTTDDNCLGFSASLSKFDVEIRLKLCLHHSLKDWTDITAVKIWHATEMEEKNVEAVVIGVLKLCLSFWMRIDSSHKLSGGLQKLLMCFFKDLRWLFIKCLCAFKWHQKTSVEDGCWFWLEF